MFFMLEKKQREKHTFNISYSLLVKCICTFSVFKYIAFAIHLNVVSRYVVKTIYPEKP
jgi:hypothetical protein